VERSAVLLVLTQTLKPNSWAVNGPPLKQIPAAHRSLEAGGSFGKCVMTIS
jgi:hypothetical protein